MDIQGQSYCGACKVVALGGKTPTAAAAVEESRTMPNKQAKESLIYGIISLFCFGFILGPIAIYKGSKARQEIAADPQLSGGGQAMAGIILGIIGTIGSIVVVATRVSR